MNERILEIAKQAGLKFPSETELSPQEKKFAELVIAAEREACAKVCDDWPVGRDDIYSIGQAIRARGEK